MQRIDRQERAGQPSTEFTSAFRELCVFLRRPSSDTVLYSDAPLDARSPSFEDISRIAERVGFEAEIVSRRALSNRNLVFPLLIVFRDSRATALLEVGLDGTLSLSTAMMPSDSVALKFAALEFGDMAYAVSFSATYLNAS